MSSQLKLVDITKKFEANTVNEKVALEHLNLTVEPGQFVTVLGSNGSGKSTMFNVILGSLFPDEGKVYLGDKDITKLKDYKRALNIGCLYQNPLRGTAPNLTIEENLALAYTRKGSSFHPWNGTRRQDENENWTSFRRTAAGSLSSYGNNCRAGTFIT